ncbi:GNAT family N-acetyltransferase [Deinococcus sp.]|uniref:GNAT family N-acetyltransferase n=1 Tax=Deinococcus sp. TaxID=47478 RepID=UPI003C7A8B47
MTLLLRPRRLADLPELWRWEHGTPDAEWKRWDGPYFHDAISELSYSDYAAKAISRPPDPNMQVIEIGGLARGMVTRSWEVPEEGGWLELGIVIYDPAFWSGGHGTRALLAWVSRCFEQTHAHVITLTTWSGNARMIGAGLKSGFRECARVRGARLWQGVRYDSVKLDLLRGEWAESAR